MLHAAGFHTTQGSVSDGAWRGEGELDAQRGGAEVEGDVSGVGLRCQQGSNRAVARPRRGGGWVPLQNITEDP
jgi:hypothetical protein